MRPEFKDMGDANGRIRYAVATSLDGYIARPEGQADWIVMDPDIDVGAIPSEFDSILVGRRTFEATTRSGNASIPGIKLFVFSRTLAQRDYPGIAGLVRGDESGDIVDGDGAAVEGEARAALGRRP